MGSWFPTFSFQFPVLTIGERDDFGKLRILHFAQDDKGSNVGDDKR